MKKDLSIIGLANDLTLDDHGWALIPYGRTTHGGKDGVRESTGAEKTGVIQEFTKEDAIALVNDFKSTWSAIKRAVVGLPIFKGHPDAPRFASRYPDKAARGSIADMEVREDGLAIRPVLTPQGGQEVESGLSQFSPYWLARKKGEELGRTIAAPFKLISIGLVERGNIPGLSLVNAAEPEGFPMKDHLIKLLAALGKTVAADATDDQIVALVNEAEPLAKGALAAQQKLATVEPQVTALTGDKTKLEGEKLALANELESTKTRATTAESNLKAERAGRAALVVAHAVASGRIKPADKEAQTLALVNAADFSAEEKRIEALKPVLKTTPGALQLSTARTPAAGASQTILSLVNEHMEKNGTDYVSAWNAITSDPKHAELVKGMSKPKA